MASSPKVSERRRPLASRSVIFDDEDDNEATTMRRTESQLPKQPMLHDSLYCHDNPKGSITVKVDNSSDKVIMDSARQSPIIQPQQEHQHQQQQPVPRANLTNTAEELLDTLKDNSLKSVKSHAQLAKTAHGVRILAKNLNKATIHLQLQSVMIITKARDNSLVYLTKEMAEWLLSLSETTEVYVDYHLENSKRFDPQGIINDIPHAKGRLKFWSKKLIRDNPDIFDLVITLGGDGTVLYASTLFQRVVPPIMSFSLGSLGFLTNFQFEDFRHVLENVIRNGVHTNLRMRFTCRVHKSNGDLVCEQQVLNELTVDRGPSPWVSMLEMYGDGSLLTVAQADGLIIATPTGSTAYSLSAGGSLVHPSVSAISVTPICPHTLSFRPILLPDSMCLKLKVPLRSRATAWASFDGRSRVELLKGHYVTVSASPFPFPTVRSSKTEYFDSVSRVLNWNNREEQKSFMHLLSDKNKKSYTTYQKRHGSTPESDLEDEDHLNKNLIYSNNGTSSVNSTITSPVVSATTTNIPPLELDSTSTSGTTASTINTAGSATGSSSSSSSSNSNSHSSTTESVEIASGQSSINHSQTSVNAMVIPRLPRARPAFHITQENDLASIVNSPSSKLKNLIVAASDDDDEGDNESDDSDHLAVVSTEDEGDDDGFEIDFNDEEDENNCNGIPMAQQPTLTERTNGDGQLRVNGTSDGSNENIHKNTLDTDEDEDRILSDSTVDIDDKEESQSNYFYPHPSEEVKTPYLKSSKSSSTKSMDKLALKNSFEKDLTHKLNKLSM